MSAFRDFILNKRVSSIINEAEGVKNKQQEAEEFEDNITELNKKLKDFLKEYKEHSVNSKGELFSVTSIEVIERLTTFKMKEYSLGLSVSCKILPETKRSQNIQEMMDNCGKFLADNSIFVVNGEEKEMSNKGARIPTAIVGNSSSSSDALEYSVSITGAWV